MSTEDVDLATRFLEALREAVLTGSLEPVFPFVAEDVEWVPRALNGIEELQAHQALGVAAEELDLQFEQGELTDHGDGRVEVNVRQLYVWKKTGELASTRERRIELVIRDHKVTRYDMMIVG